MPPSHKRGVFRTFVHRKKTSPREVESLYHKKSPLVNSCGRFFRIFRRPAEERRGGRENLRRDTPPMSPAAQRRERRMPQVPADAFPPRAKGRTTKSLRPSALPAPGLPSHVSYVSEAGRATLFVYRVGHAVPSAFVSDAVPLCSVCCLTSSPAFPRRLDRSAAPGGSVRVPLVCLEDGPRASPRAVQPEYLSGMGRRTSPRGSSSRTSIQSSHAESSRFV